MNTLIQQYEDALSRGDEDVVEFIKNLKISQLAEAYPFLIQILKSDHDIWIKNTAALALKDLADDRAVSHLMEAIKDSRNSNRIGTFIFALQTMKCNSILVELVDFIISGVGEVIEMAYQALETIRAPVDLKMIDVAEEKLRTTKMVSTENEGDVR